MFEVLTRQMDIYHLLASVSVHIFPVSTTVTCPRILTGSYGGVVVVVLMVKFNVKAPGVNCR